MEDNNIKSTYDRRMAEAGAEDVLYPSSPELTILEYITAATSKQLRRILRPDFNVEEALMGLAGFKRRKRGSMRVWTEISGEHNGFVLPANQRFKVGNVCFENERTAEVWRGKLTEVYVQNGDSSENISAVTEGFAKTERELFGKKPVCGSRVYLIFDRAPSVERHLSVYVQCRDNNGASAVIGWQMIKAEEAVDIRSNDETNGLNKSGSISFDIGDTVMEPVKLEFMEREGYVFCGTLLSCGEGAVPSVASVKGPVFPLVQRETKSSVFCFGDREEGCMAEGNIAEDFVAEVQIEGDCAADGSITECYIYSDIMEEQYVRIYVRRAGEMFYSLCGENQYQEIRQGFGQYCCRFYENYDAVAVSAYSDEAAKSFEIGGVYGYDGENFKLPFENLVRDNFSLILKIPSASGEYMYDIVRPGAAGAGGFLYELEEGSGRINIIDRGSYMGIQLYIGELSVCSGSDGILSAGTKMEPVGYDADVDFVCTADTPYSGRNESFEELKRRFTADVYRSYTAVTLEDYERIVRSVATVNTDSVNAWADRAQNRINIAVYIKGMEKGRKLSVSARKAIMEELNKHRIVSTKIELIPPVFVKVDVSAEIVVGRHYEGCEEAVKNRIRRAVDYISAKKSFGELLLFEELYREIEKEECVAEIRFLSMAPRGSSHAVVEGVNIRPADNCMLTEGNIQLILDYEWADSR